MILLNFLFNQIRAGCPDRDSRVTCDFLLNLVWHFGNLKKFSTIPFKFEKFESTKMIFANLSKWARFLGNNSKIEFKNHENEKLRVI